MRERVALFGGRLAAGPRPGGGWSMRAELPIPAWERVPADLTVAS
jgi:signal transduction histidine kinase